MAKYQRFINDEKWKLLEPLLPRAKPNGKGGRSAIDNRQVLEGILWVLSTGAGWQDAFIDGSFAPTKKGGPLLCLPNGAK